MGLEPGNKKNHEMRLERQTGQDCSGSFRPCEGPGSKSKCGRKVMKKIKLEEVIIIFEF